METFLKHSGFVLTQPDTWLKSLRDASFYTVAFIFLLTFPFGVYCCRFASMRWKKR